MLSIFWQNIESNCFIIYIYLYNEVKGIVVFAFTDFIEHYIYNDTIKHVTDKENSFILII